MGTRCGHRQADKRGGRRGWLVGLDDGAIDDRGLATVEPEKLGDLAEELGVLTATLDEE
jgi:hypothetical protein